MYGNAYGLDKVVGMTIRALGFLSSLNTATYENSTRWSKRRIVNCKKSGHLHPPNDFRPGFRNSRKQLISTSTHQALVYTVISVSPGVSFPENDFLFRWIWFKSMFRYLSKEFPFQRLPQPYIYYDTFAENREIRTFPRSPHQFFVAEIMSAFVWILITHFFTSSRFHLLLVSCLAVIWLRWVPTTKT